MIQVKTYHKYLDTRKSYFFNRLGEAEIFKNGDPAFDINGNTVILSPFEMVTTTHEWKLSNH